MAKAPASRRKPTPRSSELAALLAAVHTVLDNRTFADASKAVLGACKTILGADAGLVAVWAADGEGLEVAYRGPGGLALGSPASLPAPLQHLSARASREGRTVFANNLPRRTAKKSPLDPCSAPKNALLAPILIAGEMVGLVGLINKPGGFSRADSKVAEIFAQMAAVALFNSGVTKGLGKNRHASEKVAEVMPARTSADLRPATRPTHLLTRRELDVLRLLSKGNLNRQIAGLLGLSVRTVENHRANLMSKLGLVGRVELVSYAEEHSLL